MQLQKTRRTRVVPGGGGEIISLPTQVNTFCLWKMRKTEKENAEAFGGSKWKKWNWIEKDVI